MNTAGSSSSSSSCTSCASSSRRSTPGSDAQSQTTSHSHPQPQLQGRAQAQTRRRPRRDDFWSREYWEERFSLKPPPPPPPPQGNESGMKGSAAIQVRAHGEGDGDGPGEGRGEAFEWLGAGEELLSRLVEELERCSRQKAGASEGCEEAGWGVEGGGKGQGPLVLHIGCGSSDVGCRMRSLWEERSHSRPCKAQRGRWALERIVVGMPMLSEVIVLSSPIRSILLLLPTLPQNLDYAPSSLALTRQQELHRFGDLKMRHVVADLLSLPSLLAVLPLDATGSDGPVQGHRQLVVDGIYDKSTADAISTGPDFVLLPMEVQRKGGASTPNRSFLDQWTVEAAEEDHQNDIKTSRRAYQLPAKKLKDPDAVVLEPVEMLAYNLAAATRSGGIWAALSYSATRFDFLEKHDEGEQPSSSPRVESRGKPIPLTSLWKVESKWSVEAPGDGQAKKDVHAPEVRHWCLLLRRTTVIPSALP